MPSTKAAGPTRAAAAPKVERRQIVVLGMHRSGTSAVTGALATLGAFVGEADELTGSSQENPKGFFERRDARTICDALLHAAGADWWKVSAFDIDHVPNLVLTEQNRAIRKLVGALDAHGTWALKEPRLCLLYPLFRPHLTDPVAVLPVRHPMEVARSLRRRNGFPRVAGLALWEAYVIASLRASASTPRVIMGYTRLALEPERGARALKRALEALGVTGLRDPESFDFLDPGLYRERGGDDAPAGLMSKRQDALWEALSAGEAPPSSELTLSDEAREVLADFETDHGAMAGYQKRHVSKSEFTKLEAKFDEASAEASASRDAASALNDKIRELTAERSEEAKRRRTAEENAIRAKVEADAQLSANRLEHARDLERLEAARAARLESDRRVADLLQALNAAKEARLDLAARLERARTRSLSWRLRRLVGLKTGKG